MNSHTVVVNDCAAPAKPGLKSIRTRDTDHGPQNFRAGYAKLVEGLPATLDEHQLDWLEIITAIYAADLACKRGAGDLDWARDIELYVGVRNPAAWKIHAVPLQEIFNSLTYDRLRLHLVQDADPQPAPRLATKALPDVEALALLSGGVDSFVGGLHLLEEEKLVPAFISHSGSGATGKAQKALRMKLTEIHKGTAFLPLTTQKRGSTFPQPLEFSQRSRTMLFVCVTGVVASAKGIGDIYVNENGVMAVHVPMTAARIGSLSTRTASPPVLQRMGQLLSSVFGGTIAIKNNLLNLTKPEVVERAIALGHDSLLKTTVSCWQISHTSQHCGYCAPCMIRRISFEIHGVEDAAYLVDVFGDADQLADPSIEDNIRQLAIYVRDLTELTDTELELEYPEVLTTSRHVSPDEVRSLHRRWGMQAKEILSKYPVTSSML